MIDLRQSLAFSGARLRPSSGATVAALVASGAMAIGVATAVSPVAATATTIVLAAILTIAALGRRLPRAFLAILAALLAGYAFLSRGLAHVGIPPLYLGEMVLILALVAIAVSLRHARFTRLHVVLLLFGVLGLARTLPYVSLYGIDAFRDAVSWGYGIFAVAVSVSLRRRWLDDGLTFYNRVLPFFVLWVPMAALLATGLGDQIPAGPGSEIPIISFKGGDMGVQLAGGAAFVLLRMHEGRRGLLGRMPEIAFWALWLLAVLVVGVITRGGMFSAALGFLALLFRPSIGRLIRPMLVGLALFAAVALVNPVVDLGLERRLSLGQVIDNVLSVLSDSDDSATQAQLQGTKRFRLAWWNTIIDYTVNGPYFWTGKGFGVNLADDDGFQISADGSLRAPHNGHIEVLARMGVPGLVLWIVFNLGFAIALARRAAGRGPPVRRAIFAWLFVYWAAMVVNASFDPYLQGPQGGIWYWTVVGIGLALIARPETAEIDTEEADEADEADAEHVLGIRAPSGAGAA